VSCASWETTLGFALGELAEAEADAFEQHYFGCDRCFARLDRVQRLLDRMRQSLPLALTPERRERLANEHPEVQALELEPGARATMHLTSERSVGIWVLHAPLERATRVDVVLRRQSDGAPVISMPNVPFDAERGQVALPCQLHFREVPNGQYLEAELTASSDDGKAVTRYFLDHVYETA
jgi:hypothetical protein